MIQALFLLLPASLPAPLPPQNLNDVPLSSGEDTMFVLSDPSVGFTNGAVPPAIFSGDYFWKVYPREILHCADGVATIDAMWETMVDTDWSTPPDLWDRTIGRAYACGGTDLDGDLTPDCLPLCARVPEWLATGGFGDVLYILGDTGFPNPCTVSPPFCTTGGVCPVSGFLGYTTQWFGFQDEVTCAADLASYAPAQADPGWDGDIAITYFSPGGMVFSNPATPGSCGFGDYVFQMNYSTNETQGDCCGQGFSPYSGYASAESGTWSPYLDPLNATPSHHLAFNESVVNVIGDSGSGLGLEAGTQFGGALNGLCLDTSSGTARIAIELRDYGSLFAPNNVALVAFSSTGPIPAPGLDVFGARLLIQPDALTLTTIESGTVTFAGGLQGDALFTGDSIPVPDLGLAQGATLPILAQGFVVDLTNPFDITAKETNAWQVTLR